MPRQLSVYGSSSPPDQAGTCREIGKDEQSEMVEQREKDGMRAFHGMVRQAHASHYREGKWMI